jgi:hypothetical protein
MQLVEFERADGAIASKEKVRMMQMPMQPKPSRRFNVR